MNVDYYHIFTAAPLAIVKLNTDKAILNNMLEEARNQVDQQDRKLNVKASMSHWRVFEHTNAYNNVLTTIDGFVNDSLKFKSNLGRTRYYIKAAWVNVYGKGDYTDPHDHIPAIYSFVYCIKADEKSAPLIFKGKEDFSVNLKTDMLVIFPSYLEHFVPVIQDDQERIVMAGNIFSS